MDLITLGLAKKYTDEKVASGGGSNASVQVDSTLSQQGAAADAKVVGDALAQKADRQNGVYYIEGTEDSNGYNWYGTHEEITEYYEGLTVAYRLPVASIPGPPASLQINDLASVRIYNLGEDYKLAAKGAGSIVYMTYTKIGENYCWQANWEKSTSTISSGQKISLLGSAVGRSELCSNTGCYVGEDGELYTKGQKVGKHKNSIIYLVCGGGVSGQWSVVSEEITEYFDGLTIALKTTLGGGGSKTTLKINSLDAIEIRRSSSMPVTAKYPANSVMHLTYTTINGTGYWCMSDLWYENTDYKVSSTKYNNKQLFLVGTTSNSGSPTTGYTGYSNSGCYIGSDNYLYSNGSRVPEYETGTLTLTTEALGEDTVLTGDFFRINDMVTINFFISGTPVIAKPADSDLLDDESRKTAEIKFSGLPYPPVDDGRNWYAGGGHLQGYYPLYNQGGVATQTTFTGWTMPASGDNAGVVFARTVTEGGYAGYALAVDQSSGVKVYGAGTLTYRAQLPEVATVELEEENNDEIISDTTEVI